MRLIALNIVIWGLVAVAAAATLSSGSPPHGGGPAAHAATPAQTDDLVGVDAIDWPPAARFDDLTRRPLFTPGRRPPAQADATSTAPATEAPALTLVGVLAVGDARVALAQTADGASLRLRDGAEVQGWRVQRITARSLVLGRDARRQAYPLGQTRGDAAVDAGPAARTDPAPAAARRRFIADFDGDEDDDE